MQLPQIAVASVPETQSRTWLPGNPWSWMFLGLVCCTASWLWMVSASTFLPALRLGLVVAGLLCVALAVRWSFAEPSYLGRSSPLRRHVMRLGLAAVYLFLAGGMSVLLFLTFVWPDDYFPWRWGPALVCWVVVAPMSAIAGKQCIRRTKTAEPLSHREEAALLLLLAALACESAVGALYDKARPLNLDTIRFFLRVASVVAVVVSPLVAAPPTVGRKVISGVIVLHFASLSAAALSALKGSVVLHQFVSRISRPYLEFFVLGNPHHYFAYESPPSQLWFRIVYEDRTQEWVKVPPFDEHGNHSQTTRVNMTRMTLLVQPTTLTVPASFFDVYARPLDFYSARYEAANRSTEQEGGMYVPFLSESEMPVAQQFQSPVPSALELLKSYVRHVAHGVQQDGRRVAAVKVYRIKHNLLSVPEFLNGVKQPWDPDTYVTVYMGDFDAQGNQINVNMPLFAASRIALIGPAAVEGPLAAGCAVCPTPGGYFSYGDPLLYWVLPTVREGPASAPTFRCYWRKHAGDPAWIRNAKGQWVEDEPKP